MTIKIGSDHEGVTEVSLEALRHLQAYDHQLEEVRIIRHQNGSFECQFIFKGNLMYSASGFQIGYGGEGPRGLWKAIQMFRPKDIEGDFSKTQISQLARIRSWRWTPWKGFRPL